jgi:hypothetical protein
VTQQADVLVSMTQRVEALERGVGETEALMTALQEVSAKQLGLLVKVVEAQKAAAAAQPRVQPVQQQQQQQAGGAAAQQWRAAAATRKVQQPIQQPVAHATTAAVPAGPSLAVQASTSPQSDVAASASAPTTTSSRIGAKANGNSSSNGAVGWSDAAAGVDEWGRPKGVHDDHMRNADGSITYSFR